MLSLLIAGFIGLLVGGVVVIIADLISICLACADFLDSVETTYWVVDVEYLRQYLESIIADEDE